ncbi:hypothetical protein M0R45_015896 [Rubus argutus]|uniref:Uncharacterized protein n=1 Tax=Rubus argutus TaxID=59490 RepID=A0AAW1XSW8_RUBAR
MNTKDLLRCILVKELTPKDVDLVEIPMQLVLAHEKELVVIDDLLSAMVGIQGCYILIKRVHGREDDFTFQVDASMDLALQNWSNGYFLCVRAYAHQSGKAMAGDTDVRILNYSLCLISMFGNETSYRWVYEGVIDDPYGEFFIGENKSLQKRRESFTYLVLTALVYVID